MYTSTIELTQIVIKAIEKKESTTIGDLWLEMGMRGTYSQIGGILRKQGWRREVTSISGRPVKTFYRELMLGEGRLRESVYQATVGRALEPWEYITVDGILQIINQTSRAREIGPKIGRILGELHWKPVRVRALGRKKVYRRTALTPS